MRVVEEYLEQKIEFDTKEEADEFCKRAMQDETFIRPFNGGQEINGEKIVYWRSFRRKIEGLTTRPI